MLMLSVRGIAQRPYLCIIPFVFLALFSYQLSNSATGVRIRTLSSWRLRASDHSTFVSGLPVAAQYSIVRPTLYSVTLDLEVTTWRQGLRTIRQRSSPFQSSYIWQSHCPFQGFSLFPYRYKRYRLPLKSISLQNSDQPRNFVAWR